MRASIRVLLLAAASVIATIGGCAQPAEKPGRLSTTTSEVETINRDPVAYLRQLHQRCDALEQYRLKFYRQERLGLIPSLGEMEEIDAAFRKKPFSVKFDWADEKMPYFESTYVEGQNQNKLVIRERKGILLSPPQIRKVDVDLPVAIGKAKNPITVFGLANIVRRTLEPFEDAQLKKDMTIRCVGVVNLDPTGRPAYHLRIERPPTAGYRYTGQDFYIDVESGWPAGTDLWLKDGQLDARYRYAAVDVNVQLTDADFAIKTPASRPAGSVAKQTAVSAPAAVPRE